MKLATLRYALVAAALMVGSSAFAVNDDAGSGPNGSDSPESQPTAKKQAGPSGHCWRAHDGRTHCRNR
jgi:hypothetical protein